MEQMTMGPTFGLSSMAVSKQMDFLHGSWLSSEQVPQKNPEFCMSFYDVALEIMYGHFCYTLLVETIIRPSRFKKRKERPHLLMGGVSKNL